MKFLTNAIVLTLVFSTNPLLLFSQTQTPISSPTPATAPISMAFGLHDGTPVKLRIARNMSSADAKTGETVDFEVVEEVKVGEILVVPKGGIAIGTVTLAKPKGMMGKGGKLDLNIDYVRLVNGDKAALRAVKENKGGSTTAAMTGAIVASAILFFPAAPFFLFMKGKDIRIPKGTEFTAYVNGETPLEQKKFMPVPAVTATTEPAPATPVIASISVKSTPDGADLSVDGKFVGSTPSTLQIPPGDHVLSITKGGYNAWERTISLTGGAQVNVDATLEKTP